MIEWYQNSRGNRESVDRKNKAVVRREGVYAVGNSSHFRESPRVVTAFTASLPTLEG